MECVGKNCCAATEFAACRKSVSSLSFPGAGEGNRTPDPLITNQMLYRLSYASNWGQARLRANLSHGSLPDVRDNYIKYHTAKLGCNNGFEGESWVSCLADAADVAPRSFGPLFLPQRHHGIDTCSPSRRNDACRQRNSDEDQRDEA